MVGWKLSHTSVPSSPLSLYFLPQPLTDLIELYIKLFSSFLPSLSSFFAFPSLLNPPTAALNFHPGAAAAGGRQENTDPKRTVL